MGGWFIILGFLLFLISVTMGKQWFFMGLGCVIIGFSWGKGSPGPRPARHKSDRHKSRRRLCTNPYCRHANEPTARFCERCGRPLNA